METGQAKVLKTITEFLSTSDIPYMITGSWSSIYYGRPRASHDIDFVVEIPTADINKVTQAFSQIPDDYMVQLITIREAVEQKNLFQVIDLQTMLKIDFWILTDQEFDKSRFARRKKVKLFNSIMDMATPEDTIIQKLIWYEKSRVEKHLIDAAFVVHIQGTKLDNEYIHVWLKKLQIEKYFKLLDKVDIEEHL